MSEIVTPILQWLNSNPEMSWIATFIISAAESVAIIGTIVPGTVMMTAVGALVGAGIIPFWSTLLFAILGAIVGDGISYWLGHYFKDRLRLMWPFRKHPYLLESGEKFCRKFGGMSVFIGRFVGPVRALVPVVAGMLGMKPLRFTIANVTSAILWAPIYMLPGFILGAASTELPSELAGRIILMLFLTGLVITLCLWLLKKIIELIATEINQFLDWLWHSLKSSRHFHLITFVIKHHDYRKSPQQLALIFYLSVACLAFIYLSSYVVFKNADDILLNNFTFHLFRSLRTVSIDDIMLYITLLGDKHVLLPLVVTTSLFFGLQRHWYTAIHILILGALTALSIHYLKELTHSPRPWGVVGNANGSFSYPSGHATMAFTFYFAITLYLIKSYAISRRKRLIPYTLVGALVGLICISRLYFGVHWLTDIIGGVLLGTILLLLISLSYNRIAQPAINCKNFILTVFVTLCISYSTFCFINFEKIQHKYTLLPWPSFTIPIDSWWEQRDGFFPIYRVNRFGFSASAFNVQWVDNLEDIKKVLLQNNWEVPPPRDWITILYRLSAVQSTEHLPLVSPLYLDKRPALVLTKHIQNEKLVILRFWRSQFLFTEGSGGLWVGSMEYPPSTYSWLFKHRPGNGFILSEIALFNKIPKNYDVKKLLIAIEPNSSIEQPVILIKPKSLNIHH